MRSFVSRCVLAAGICARGWGADPPAKPELERLNSMIEELSSLKAQAAAMEAKIDALVRALSEQRGALQAKPVQYDALKTAAVETAADPKPVTVRCAALTSAGKRCTRAAGEGSRYCKQHALARQK